VEIRRQDPVKVLLVNYEFPPLGGGAANATMFMGRALVRLGHEATVLTSGFGSLQGHAVEEGVHVFRLRVRRERADRSGPREMLSFLVAALRAAPRIARERSIEAAVVYFTIPCGPVGYILRRRRGIPYVLSLRGGDVPGLVPELDATHRLIAPIRRALLRRALGVVANSESLARLSEATDPIPVAVIPNGVDAEYFSPAPMRDRDPDSNVRVLFVGRFTAQKNLPVLLEAVADLRRDSGCRFVIDVVGDGPLRDEWTRIGRNLRLDEVIHWHGWLSKDELRELYRQADCFANPSLYEGMPNTVLEAMACGLPVIASDIGGNDALVKHGGNGFLFSLEQPEGLREALRAFAQDAELRRRMGDAGRRRVVSEFSWESVASCYVELIEARRGRAH
jgi:glycosyltransferase involved in cell wall biosynthesis